MGNLVWGAWPSSSANLPQLRKNIYVILILANIPKQRSTIRYNELFAAARQTCRVLMGVLAVAQGIIQQARA